MQSYGSRYVRPPIIVGDISRTAVSPWAGRWVAGLVLGCAQGLLQSAIVQYGAHLPSTAPAALFAGLTSVHFNSLSSILMPCVTSAAHDRARV